jgi:hypothetical protein
MLFDRKIKSNLLTQEKYILDLLTKFHMFDYKKVLHPCLLVLNS